MRRVQNFNHISKFVNFIKDFKIWASNNFIWNVWYDFWFWLVMNDYAIFVRENSNSKVLVKNVVISLMILYLYPRFINNLSLHNRMLQMVRKCSSCFKYLFICFERCETVSCKCFVLPGHIPKMLLENISFFLAKLGGRWNFWEKNIWFHASLKILNILKNSIFL